MIESMELAGSVVLLRFHYGKRGSINPIISKTMGKVAVINHAYQSAMPQAGSFWLCRIEKEITNEVKNTGCFIVTPVRPVPIEEIQKLIPGAYEIEIKNKTIMCKPLVDNVLWIVPFNIKKFYIKKEKAKVLYESIIVPLSGVI